MVYISCFVINNWSDVSSVATTFGVVVGIIGLFFVWRQIKMQTDQLKEQCYQYRYQMFLEMDKILIEDPCLKKLICNRGFEEWCKANNIPCDDKKVRESAFIEMTMNMCQISFHQYKDRKSSSELNWIREVLDNEHVLSYWRSNYRCAYSKGFKLFIKSEYENKGIIIENL